MKYRRKKTKSTRITKTTTSDGTKFDSRLEKFFYDAAKREKLPFDFQRKYILVHPFKYNKESVRAMTLTVDFDFTNHGIDVIVDTKGFQRNDNKLKWKLFKNFLINQGKSPEIYFPKNQKECLEVVGILKKFCKLAKLNP